MDKLDIRWKQRFNNYKKALNRLNAAVKLSKERKLSDIEEQGLIKAFEFTFDLSWNVMKDYLEYMGIENVIGSKGAIREAFKNGMLCDGQIWMDMVKDRNSAAHSYDEKTKDAIIANILKSYCGEFISFEAKMSNLEEADL